MESGFAAKREIVSETAVGLEATVFASEVIVWIC